MSPAPQDRTFGWAGIAAVLGAPALVVLSAQGLGGDAISLGRELIWWSLGTATLLWALCIEQLSPASLGFRRPRLGNVGWGIVVGLLMILVTGICYGLLFPALGLNHGPTRLALIASRPVWVVALLALRAALVEEWLFRCYPISRLQALTGSPVIATLLPAAVFIALRAGGWGVAHLLPVSLMTIVLTALYWRRRDFSCNAVAHFVADFIPFVVASTQANH